MRVFEMISWYDWVIAPFYLLLIFFHARAVQKRNIESQPIYRFYTIALFCKLMGGICVCLIYTNYYYGGDTTNFFSDAILLNKVLFRDPGGYFYLITHSVDEIDYSLYDASIGYPIYVRDSSAYFIVKLTSVFVFFGFRSYIVATILMAWISFFGVWKLYRVFADTFPELSTQFAIGVFFMPSVFFWGSGILKDTVTFSAIGYFVSSFNALFISRKKIFANIIIMLFVSNIILIIRPYLLIGLLPGCFLWVIMSYSERVSGTMKKALVIPLFVMMVTGLGYLMLFLLQESLGQYSADNLVYKAVETQKDLKSDYYQGNTFDIGEYEPTLSGILKKAPIAIFTCIFRPAINEANNIVMMVSAIENTFVLLLALRTLIRIRIVGILKYFLRHSLLTYSLIFTFFFAFSVGFSTSNFGSLVRYKIPIIPFFVCSLYIINHLHKLDKQSAVQKIKQFTPIGAQI